MKELTLKQIADWCGGKVSARFEHLRVSRMQSDSRKVRSGDLFVALKGAKADGHDFAETAINHGAVAALVSRPISEKLPSIEVEDTLRAYGEIAAGYRKLTGVKVVGITGSVGKTTTKEMTASVLEAAYHTAKTEGNHNNNLGLPMTIMDMPENTEVAVLEMGMNHSGEMEYLSDHRPAGPCHHHQHRHHAHRAPRHARGHPASQARDHARYAGGRCGRLQRGRAAALEYPRHRQA